jgi:NodT family efflux transporter outer membrane factor (OMF) lipoprotein
MPRNTTVTKPANMRSVMHARLSRSRIAGVAALLTMLGGCDLGPDYRKPALDIPPQFRATPATQVAAWPSEEWWRGFNSPELDQLIDLARVQNFDIAAAVARIREADAQVRIAGAPLLPSLDATGAASWSQVGVTSRGFGTGGGGTSTRTIDLHNYNLGINVAYQADFWGHNFANRQAAVSTAVFSRFDQQTVALTVVTAVAQTWLTALALADRLNVAQQNVAASEQVLAVIRARLDAGTATALDEAQQEALLDSQRANIPAFRNQLESELNGLGILVGEPPERITVRPGTLTALSLPPVWPGLPSELLARRPDVASAEAQLVSANFSIKAARAAFFPTIQLTGQRGFANAALGTLFSPGSMVASVAASALQPVFDAGLLRGELEQAKGRYDELLADYRKSVVQAFTDVEAALIAWRYTTEQEAAEQQAVVTARRANEIARAQLEVGTVDVTTVLNTELTLYTNEDALTQIRLSRFLALLSLYRALGGGWTEPSLPIPDQFPGLSPGMLPGGVALPVGGNLQ